MSAGTTVTFRLYIAGDAPNSVQALFNLRELCRVHLAGRHEIDIVDVFTDPARALSDGIYMTPTLVRVAPRPARKVVGALSHAEIVLQAMEIERVPA